MEKLIDLAALAEQLGGEEWVYSRASLHSRGYIVGRGGRTIVQTTDGDVPANVCRFIQMADPATILAIAKAFQALEQENAELRQQRAGLAKEANDFEAKLAELANQPPVAYTDAEELDTMQKGTYADMFKPCDEYKSDPQWIPLFTRPAPAADLAELFIDAINEKQDQLWECRRAMDAKDCVEVIEETTRKIQEQTK